jgi:hypothetical protein
MNRRHWIISAAVAAAGVIGFQVGDQGPKGVLPVPVDRPLIGIASVDGEAYVRAVREAVDDLGKGLRIVARSPDGVVEATETTDADRFLIGVQWHPEGLVPDDERQERLFKAFVEAARKVKVE